eukprot:TRINITY_DN11136_c0_g1_i1.p3 TRINITY_DN11136_c0_g1~~TRINITY_DN11136_c0_g1_i1.p3  ORF type:complete len:133 (-),score=36.77 TRINITY_DN11136_c0_g1_i1:41-439(-)
MEYISRMHAELQDTKKQLNRSEIDRKELVQSLALFSDENIHAQEQKLLQQMDNNNSQNQNNNSNSNSNSNQLPTQSSVGSNPDAIQIAEEMSKKVVLLQSEKEELEEALQSMKLDNQQLKQVKEQLEVQVVQ